MLIFSSSRLWWLSCQAYQRGWLPIAKLLKVINFVVFHAVLPYEADLAGDVILAHHGLGVVIHPNVKIGHQVRIYQNVTLAAQTGVGSEHKIFLEDRVFVGAGAAIIGRGDQSLRIGAGATIGANAVVTHDVLPNQTVAGVPARLISKIAPASTSQ